MHMMEPRFFSTVDGNLLSRANLLRFIRDFVRVSNMGKGYYLEFGVLNGASMVESYGVLRGHLTQLVGFDTFAGLPELSEQDQASNGLMPEFKKGNFCSMPMTTVKQSILAHTSGLRDTDVTLVQGGFSETLPKFDVKAFKDWGSCLVVNVDCDLYSSSADVFRFLDGIVTTGTWLLLDDYWCYRGSPKHGQRKAFEEWLRTSKRIGATEYASYNGYSKAFVIHEK